MEKQQVIQLLQQNNDDTKKTSEDLGITHSKLLNYCWYHDIPYKLKNARIDPTHVQELYNTLGSLSEVAKQLGATKEGIRCLMIRHRMTINKQIQHTVNDSFFSHDSEHSLYWAGFLAADGNITKGRDQLSVGLAIKDINHLQNFVDNISWTGKISEGYVDKERKYRKCEVRITSKQIVSDLRERFNIVPQKTFIYTFPERLIGSEYVNHFMRGYFDGDGCFYTPSTKKPTKQVYFNLLGTKEFMNIFAEKLSVGAGIHKNKIGKRANVYKLEYGGNGITTKIKDFLYKDATVYLKRKFDIVNSITQTHTPVL